MIALDVRQRSLEAFDDGVAHARGVHHGRDRADLLGEPLDSLLPGPLVAIQPTDRAVIIEANRHRPVDGFGEVDAIDDGRFPADVSDAISDRRLTERIPSVITWLREV